MGSVYAGLLGAAGNDVWAVDTWELHVEAIRAHGLRVEGASGDHTVRIGATTRAADLGEVDLIVVSTKAMDVRDASAAAYALAGPETVVLPIQNGIGSAEAVAAIFGPERTVIGVAGGSAPRSSHPGTSATRGWSSCGSASSRARRRSGSNASRRSGGLPGSP